MACIVCNPTNATVEQLNHRYNTICGVGFDIAQQCGKHDEQTVRKEAKKAIDVYFKSTPYPEQPNSTRALLHPHVQASVLETQDCYLCSPNDALLEKCVFRLFEAKFTLQHFPVCEQHMIDEEIFEKAGKESFMFLAEQTVAMNMVKAGKEDEATKLAPKKKKKKPAKKMKEGEPQANEADNERLADNTGKVLEIAKAWAQIEIAHTSLKNAYDTLKTFDRKQLPAKVLKTEMRNLRKIAKDMAELGMKEEKAADEDVKGDDEQTESKDEKDMDKGREVASEDDDSYATGIE